MCSIKVFMFILFAFEFISNFSFDFLLGGLWISVVLFNLGEDLNDRELLDHTELEVWWG
jgi:hypothetical protein